MKASRPLMSGQRSGANGVVGFATARAPKSAATAAAAAAKRKWRRFIVFCLADARRGGFLRVNYGASKRGRDLEERKSGKPRSVLKTSIALVVLSGLRMID